ncbi:hypothetical protein [Haladaptatus sp. GCM10025893]|uniref:hypothetical protein n=1 Tax=Haladaptatus sp. GCM10025893 TaxID=3252659 RepID=UPI00360C69EE
MLDVVNRLESANVDDDVPGDTLVVEPSPGPIQGLVRRVREPVERDPEVSLRGQPGVPTNSLCLFVVDVENVVCEGERHVF